MASISHQYTLRAAAHPLPLTDNPFLAALEEKMLKVLAGSLVALLAAAPPALAEARVDSHVGFSLGWFASPMGAGPALKGGGALPVEVGLGTRTDRLRLGLFARGGLFHYGVGLEFAAAIQGWRSDGMIIRVAPQLLVDAVTCLHFGGAGPCDTAEYAVADIGISWRWARASGGGFSLGAAFEIGQQHINLHSSGGVPEPSWSGLVIGVQGPRLSWDF